MFNIIQKRLNIIFILFVVPFFDGIAQQNTQANIIKPEPCDTQFGLIPKKNYKCFMRKYEYDAKRVKEKKTKAKFNNPSRREEIKKEKVYAPFQERQKERNQQAIEYSRSRNVSNKGMRYRITFGRVLEPQE